MRTKKSIATFLRDREYGLSQRTRVAGIERDIVEEKATIPTKNTACELSGQCRSTLLMTFSPDGCRVASAHGDHTVRVSSLSTGRCTHVLTGHPRSPWCLAFHPSCNDLLASGCLGGQVRIWDLKGGGCEMLCPVKDTVVSSLTFHPVEQVLVMAVHNSLYFWDWKRPEPFASCRTSTETERVRWVKFDSLGHFLYTGIANASDHQEDEMHGAHVSFTCDTEENDGGSSRTNGDREQNLQQRYRSLLNRINANQLSRINAAYPPATSRAAVNTTPQGEPSSTSQAHISISSPHSIRRFMMHPSQQNPTLRQVEVISRPISADVSLTDSSQSGRLHQVNERQPNSSFRCAARSTLNPSATQSPLSARSLRTPLPTPRLQLGPAQSFSSRQETLSSGNVGRQGNGESLSPRSLLRVTVQSTREATTSEGQHRLPNPALNTSRSSSILRCRLALSDSDYGQNSATTPQPVPPVYTVYNVPADRQGQGSGAACDNLEVAASQPSFNPSQGRSLLSNAPLSNALDTLSSDSILDYNTPSENSHTNHGISSNSRNEDRNGRRYSGGVEDISETDNLTNNILDRPNVSPAGTSIDERQTLPEGNIRTGSFTSTRAEFERDRLALANALERDRQALESSLEARQLSPEDISNVASLSNTGDVIDTVLRSARSSSDAWRSRNIEIMDEDGNARSSFDDNSRGATLERSPANHPRARHLQSYLQNGAPSQLPVNSTRPHRLGAGLADALQTLENLQNELISEGHVRIPSASSSHDGLSVSTAGHSLHTSPSSRTVERNQSVTVTANSGAAIASTSSSSRQERNPRPVQVSESLRNIMSSTQNVEILNNERLRTPLTISVPLSPEYEEEHSDSEMTTPPSVADANPDNTDAFGRIRERMSEIQQQLHRQMRLLHDRRVRQQRNFHNVSASSARLQSIRERISDRRRRLREHLTELRRRRNMGNRSPPLAREERSPRVDGLPPTGSLREDVMSEQRARRTEGRTAHIRARLYQRDSEQRSWHALQRRMLHPHYAVSILDDTVNRSDHGLQAAINRAIAGAYVATGEMAVANNIVNLTHRIQQWDFTKGAIPDLHQTTLNIIVPHCKMHNDSSCDISADGRYLATFVPIHRGFPDDTVLAVYSLAPETSGQCLFTKSFGPNAISVSLSPLGNYVLVGLASKKLAWVFTPKQMVAQVFRLKEEKAGEDSMEHICDLMHPCEIDVRNNVSVNATRWLPVVGEGLCYGTNRGDLHICRPGYEEAHKHAESEGNSGSVFQRNLMQILGIAGPRTSSTATQTVQRVRRSAATQTDQSHPVG